MLGLKCHSGIYDFTIDYDITVVGLWHENISLLHHNIDGKIMAFIISQLIIIQQWQFNTSQLIMTS